MEKLTSNWSRAEVGALRKAKKEFCESWCLTPLNTEQMAQLLVSIKTSKSDLNKISHKTLSKTWRRFHMT